MEYTHFSPRTVYSTFRHAYNVLSDVLNIQITGAAIFAVPVF